MTTKAKSYHVFTVRLWSRKHYNKTITKKNLANIFDGTVFNVKTKELKHIHSASDFLKAIEKMYYECEKNEE